MNAKNRPPFLPLPPFFFSLSFSFFFILFFSFSKSEFFGPKHGYKNTAYKASPAARGPLGRFASKKRIGVLKIPLLSSLSPPPLFLFSFFSFSKSEFFGPKHGYENKADKASPQLEDP